MTNATAAENDRGADRACCRYGKAGTIRNPGFNNFRRMKAPSISEPSASKARRRNRRVSEGFHAGSPEPSTVETTTGPQTVPADTLFESSSRCSNAVFRLEAPHAGTVKLAADFTSWEKRTLDLRPAEDGAWRITVLLPPDVTPTVSWSMTNGRTIRLALNTRSARLARATP